MQQLPTNVRWRILALLMAYAGMCHFNRLSISRAGNEHIMQEYGLSETQMGFVFSSYLLVYTLCMMPGGRVIDRIGPKRALMILGFASAILVPLTGLSSFAAAGSILFVLCAIRGLLGAVSTPLHPACARAVSFWFPYQARGFANGMVTAGAVLGIASTYFVFGYLMDAFGWPWAFFVAGCATLLLTIVWSVSSTDHPAQHPATNAAERQLVAHGSIADEPEDETAGQVSAGRFIDRSGKWIRENRSLLLVTFSYAAYGYFQYLFFYWMDYYFREVLGMSTGTSRFYSTVATLAMAFGMFAGGWVADRMETRFGVRRGRAITPVTGMLASALILILGFIANQTPIIVGCCVLSMGVLGICESSFWVTSVELGRKRGGFSASVLNTGGNAGGIISPTLTPAIAEHLGWNVGIGVACGLCILGALLWLWVVPVGPQGPASSATDREAEPAPLV